MQMRMQSTSAREWTMTLALPGGTPWTQTWAGDRMLMVANGVAEGAGPGLSSARMRDAWSSEPLAAG